MFKQEYLDAGKHHTRPAAKTRRSHASAEERKDEQYSGNHASQKADPEKKQKPNQWVRMAANDDNYALAA